MQRYLASLGHMRGHTGDHQIGGGYFGRHAHQPQGTTACASHSFTEGDTKAEGVTTEGFNTEGSAYDKFLKYTAATIVS